MYHLAWFLPQGFAMEPWSPAGKDPWEGHNVTQWMKPDIYCDLAQATERAGFDFMLLEDTNEVDDTFRGSTEFTLRYGRHVPKNDPMPLIPLMAQRTKHLGFVPTVSTSFYPPYLAGRLLATLDHLTEGRVGFNLVTSISEQAAQSYGMDGLPPKAERYERATEWVEIVKGLMGSWDADAIVADVENSVFADHTKVHRLDYKGKYYNCRGPLNTVPGPQGIIPMVQAGNSPSGRELTAQHAQAMLAVGTDVAQMKNFVSDMRARLKNHGRDPASCKIMFIISPVIARTDQEAQDRHDEAVASTRTPGGLEALQYFVSKMIGFDFGQFDLDMTGKDIMKALEDSGRAAEGLSVMNMLFQGNEALTLQEILLKRDLRAPVLGLVGSPETVASRMDEMMQEVGADGYLVNLPTTRMRIAEFCDGVAPILQRRGSVRSGYEATTLQENLLAF
jgi:FMN-dependent oxidoreductase (nitrilotriacetate monooxygenase family)